MPITISGSTGVAGVDGSQGNPALQGGTTSTSGIYYGSNIVNFSTASTLRAQLDASGNFNIGTTGVAAQLYVAKNSASAIVGLTDAATIAVDMSLGNNFSVTLGGNRTLGNPTNLTAGQSGIIFLTQDGTGSRTLAYSSYWKFPNGVTPVLTTTASAVDAIIYTVRTTTSITCNYALNIG